MLPRDESRSAAKFLQESILIAFDFIWKALLSDRNFCYPFGSDCYHLTQFSRDERPQREKTLIIVLHVEIRNRAQEKKLSSGKN